MPSTREPRERAERLSRDAWADAALEAIADGGVAAVAVERLAERLGATKGSFYWHFRNRDALVAAALERWEAQHTDALIGAMDAEPDPAQRLRRLFVLISGPHPANRIELALLATASDPTIAPVLARVTERRVGYVAAVYEELGWEPTIARRQALFAYTAWLGFTQLAHAVPEVLPAERQLRSYLDHVLDTVLSEPPSAPK